MENKSIPGWLCTPFRYVAGGKALIAGIGVMGLLSLLGYLSNTHFDGVIDIHYKNPDSSHSYWLHLVYQLSSWIILTAVFYITARIISKSSVRLIDIAGTFGLSQAPLILAALWGFIPGIHLQIGNSKNVNLNQLTAQLQENIFILLISLIVVIAIVIWNIVIKYNAYSISANVKGKTGYISFGIALFVSEVLSIIFIRTFVPLAL